MIVGIGIDIVENRRIDENTFNNLKENILTVKENEVLLTKKGKKKLEYLCGRFAGKEAVIKAIGDKEILNMKEIEILNRENGKPYVILKDYNILISISHEKNYTIAEAIVLKEDNNA